MPVGQEGISEVGYILCRTLYHKTMMLIHFFSPYTDYSSGFPGGAGGGTGAFGGGGGGGNNFFAGGGGGGGTGFQGGNMANMHTTSFQSTTAPVSLDSIISSLDPAHHQQQQQHHRSQHIFAATANNSPLSSAFNPATTATSTSFSFMGGASGIGMLDQHQHYGAGLGSMGYGTQSGNHGDQIPRGHVINGNGIKIEPPDWTMDVIESKSHGKPSDCVLVTVHYCIFFPSFNVPSPRRQWSNCTALSSSWS